EPKEQRKGRTPARIVRDHLCDDERAPWLEGAIGFLDQGLSPLLALGVNDVPENHDLVFLLAEIDLPQIAFKIVVPCTDAELLSVLLRHGCDLRVVHCRYSRVRQRLRERQRPCARSCSYVENAFDLL